jgi:hypothetical protein
VWYEAFDKPCRDTRFDTYSNTHSDDPYAISNFVTVSDADHGHFLSNPNPHHDM